MIFFNKYIEMLLRSRLLLSKSLLRAWDSSNWDTGLDDIENLSSSAKKVSTVGTGIGITGLIVDAISVAIEVKKFVKLICYFLRISFTVSINFQ